MSVRRQTSMACLCKTGVPGYSKQRHRRPSLRPGRGSRRRRREVFVCVRLRSTTLCCIAARPVEPQTRTQLRHGQGSAQSAGRQRRGSAPCLKNGRVRDRGSKASKAFGNGTEEDEMNDEELVRLACERAAQSTYGGRPLLEARESARTKLGVWKPA